MKKIFALAVVMLLLAACEKNITVHIPDAPAKLVVNGVMETGDSIRVFLSSTVPIRQNGQSIPPVSGATVILTQDGFPADTLLERTDTPGLYRSRQRARSVGTYHLQIAATGFETISTTDSAPASVPIMSYDVQKNARKDADGNEQDLLTVTFSDPAGTKDYYLLQIEPPDGNTPCTTPADASIEKSTSSDDIGSDDCVPGNAIFFSDALFNGTVKKLKLYVSSYELEPQQNGLSIQYTRLILSHVSVAYYSYLRSYLAADDANGDPFAEPFNVSTNVVNGYGIFSVFTETSVEVQ